MGDEPEGEVVSEDRRDEALDDVVVVTDSIVNGDNNIEQVNSNSHQHLSTVHILGGTTVLFTH